MKFNFLLFSLLVLTGCSNIFGQQGITKVFVGGQLIKVESVSSSQDLAKGLAGVEKLDWNEGMLFIFPRKDYYSFWMKDMLIPLDIIWLDGQTIVDLTVNVLPPADLNNQNDLPVYDSSKKADYVLEVRAGFIEKYGLKVGDSVEFR